MSYFDLLLEAERRGILPEDKKQMLTEARNRGLIPVLSQPDQQPVETVDVQEPKKYGVIDTMGRKFMSGLHNTAAGVDIAAGGVARKLGMKDASNYLFDKSAEYRDIARGWSAGEADGTVSRVAGAVAEAVPSLAGFAANPIAGLFLAAAPSITDAADSVDQGLSTPRAVGNVLVDATLNAAGTKIPAAIGKRLVTKVATGVGGNVAMGAAGDVVKNQIAGDNEAVAAKYDPTNLEARIADALFGGVATASHIKSQPGLALPDQVQASVPQQSTVPTANIDADQIVADALQNPAAGKTIADIISESTGAPKSATPQDAIRSEIDRAALSRRTGSELRQGELAKQVRLYGDELPPQYQQAPISLEQAIAAIYQDHGINPQASANAFNRARVADQMELPESQRDITNRENTNELARQAFNLAASRQNRADADLAQGRDIAQDYQGGLSAATAGTNSAGTRSVMMYGDNVFEVMRDAQGNPRLNEKGEVYGAIVDEAGNSSYGFVPTNRLKQFDAPAEPRLAQDFMARSNTPPRGVGTETMQQERMPRRSTDRISGDRMGGQSSPLSDPYEASPRSPRGSVDVEQSPQNQQTTEAKRIPETIEQVKAPREGVDNLLTEPPKTENAPAQEPIKMASQGDGIAEPEITSRTEAMADTSKEPKATIKSEKPVKHTSLLTTIKRLGGLRLSDKWDVTGEKNFARGGWNPVFKKAATKSIDTYIENGDLDDYLPYHLRKGSSDFSGSDYDPTAARDYLVDRIRNGEEVLPYDAEMEMKYKKFDSTQYIDEATKQISPDEINRMLREAGYEEGEINARLNEPDVANEDSGSISGQRQAASESTGGSREPKPEPAKEPAGTKDLLGDDTAKEQAVADAERAKDAKRNAGDGNSNDFVLTGSTRQADEAAARGAQDLFDTPAPEQTKPDIKNVVEGIIKRRAAADQIFKTKAFDEYLQHAKDFMAGEPVKPSIFQKAASVFKNDNALSGAYNTLADMAKAPAKEVRAKTTGAIEAFRDRINKAATADELRDISKEIQQSKLSDAKVQELDDLAMGRMDEMLDAYDQDVESVKRDAGPGGSEFYSGIPVDKVVEATLGAAKKLLNSDFLQGQLAEAKAIRGAFKSAAEADKKAAGSKDGAIKRGAKLALSVFDGAINSQVGILDGLAKKHNSKALTDLVSHFTDRAGTTGAGENGATYYQEIEQHFTGQMNKLADLFADDSKMGDTALWNAITSRVKRQAFDNTEAGKMAKSIADLLAGELKRMRDAGVDVGEYKGYFPDRELNEHAILSAQKNFEAAATRAYIKDGASPAEARQKASDWVKAVLLGNHDAQGSPFMPSSASPNSSFTKARSLSNEASQIIKDAGFYYESPLESLTTYFYRTSRKAAYERRFGGIDSEGRSGAKYRELENRLLEEGNGELINVVKTYLPSLLGEMPSTNTTAATRKAVSFLQTANVVTYLSGVGTLLTSLPEPVIAASRTGNMADIPRAIAYTARNIASTTAKKLGFDQNWAKSMSQEQSVAAAEMIGIMSHRMLNDTMLHNRLGGDMAGRTQSALVQRVLSLNGIVGLTRMQRAAAVEIGAKFINQLAGETVSGTPGKLTTMALSEIGIPEAKHGAFSKWLQDQQKAEYGGIKLDNLNADSEMHKLYREALYRFTSQSIMNPNRGQMPRAASHPVGKVAYGLLSYTHAYADTVLKRSFRMGKEAFSGDGYTTSERMKMLAPALIAFGVVPMMQYALMPIRDQLNGLTQDQEERRKKQTVVGLDGKTLEALQRSGVFGQYEPIINLVTGMRYNRDMANVLLGASGGGLVATTQSGINYLDPEKNSDNTNSAERKLATDVWATVVEPTLVTASAMNLPTALALPLQLGIKNKRVRDKAVDTIAGKKQDSNGGSSTDDSGDFGGSAGGDFGGSIGGDFK